MPLSFAPMPRGAFTGFQMIFLFLLSLLPEAESECRVCPSAPWMKQVATHSGQSGKNDCCRPAGQVLSDRKTIILPLWWFALFTLRWCLFHFGGSLFYGFSPEVCGSRHTFVLNLFWAMVCRRTKPLLRKKLMNEGLKKREFISKSRIK